jgi:hypothetical protein
MKKILIFVLIAIFSRCDNDEYSSFSEELENSAYVHKHSSVIDGQTEKFETYVTFDFSSYAYKTNSFTVEGVYKADCYSTYIYNRDGQIIADTDSSVTYVQGGKTTYTITKLNNGIRIQQQSSGCGSNCNWTWLKSDISTLESLKVGKRQSNTCN